jgi:hypothetical protein
MKNKYKITQVYSTVENVHLNKKLETPRQFGTFLGVSALQALRIASQYTNIAEICLHADRVEES